MCRCCADRSVHHTLLHFGKMVHRPFVHIWHRRPVNTKWHGGSGTTWIKIRITCKGQGPKEIGAESHVTVRNEQ